MTATVIARNEFDPPGPGGLGRALVLALAAHALLMLALTWGLRWNSQPQDLAVQAELWSPTVRQAAPPAPPAVQTPPPPAPVRPSVADEQRDAEIALAQKKQREAQQRQLAEREQQRKERELAARKAAQEAQRKEQLAKAEAEKKTKADKDAEIARRMEALRHMSTLAAGDDERDAGPSGGYAGLIRAAVRPNIVFTDDAPGNPVAEVEVRTGPTGTIISRRITRPSGVKAWDEAVLRALDRTDRLPSDQGRYWNPMLITFRMRD